MSHHKEAGPEGTGLRVVLGSLCTLSLLNPKNHQQVDGVQARGDDLSHVGYSGQISFCHTVKCIKHTTGSPLRQSL